MLQLDNLAQVIRAQGDPRRATRLASAAKAHQRSTGTSLGQLLSEQEGRSGTEGLSEAEGAQAWAEGQGLTLDQALAEAVAAAKDAAASPPKSDG